MAPAAVGRGARVGASRARSRAGGTPQARKFSAVIGGLLALGAISLAVAVALVISGGGRQASAGNWSNWQPGSDGLAGEQEIADFVGPYYRATPAYPLAVVTATNLSNSANPVAIVLPSTGATSGVQALPAGSTAAYNLCGLGSQDCSIGVGAPSSDRLLLLRREALELALYTFKYISGTQAVVAILPPGHTASGCTGICPKPHTTTQTKAVDLAVAFDRRQLAPFLAQPLRYTLPEPLPPTVSQITAAPEAELISLLTAHSLFQTRTEQTQNGSTLIVLTPMPAS